MAATAQGLAGLWFDGQAHHPGPLDAPVDAQQPFIAQAREELALLLGAVGGEVLVEAGGELALLESLGEGITLVAGELRAAGRQGVGDAAGSWPCPFC